MRNQGPDPKELFVTSAIDATNKAEKAPITPHRICVRIANDVRSFMLTVLASQDCRDAMSNPDMKMALGSLIGESAGDLECAISEHQASALPLNEKEIQKGEHALRAIELISGSVTSTSVSLSLTQFAERIAHIIQENDYADGIHRIVAKMAASEAVESIFPLPENEDEDDRYGIKRVFTSIALSRRFTDYVNRVYKTRTETQGESEGV